MFESFDMDFTELRDATLRVRHSGTGEPLLLLHGHPRTHTTWHRVAPLLATSFRIVCTTPPRTVSKGEGKERRLGANFAGVRECPRPYQAQFDNSRWNHVHRNAVGGPSTSL